MKIRTTEFLSSRADFPEPFGASWRSRTTAPRVASRILRFERMAGHDMNYLALSGTLDLFRRADERPAPPVNFAGDYAGGAHMRTRLPRARHGFAAIRASVSAQCTCT